MTILIVEDDPMLSRVLRNRWESELPGSKILLAKSFGEFREMYPSSNADVIFMDLSLPDSSWDQTIEEVRKLDAYVPVIIMTGHPASRVLTQMGRPIEVVEKNVGFFPNIIRALVRKWSESAIEEERANMAEIRRALQLLKERNAISESP